MSFRRITETKELTEQNPVTIIYHADCIDGFGSAYAAWCAFGDQANYCPMHHGETWDDAKISGADVYILDFSFAPEKLDTIAALAHSVTQLDHHLSAQQAWVGKLQATDNGYETYECSERRLKVSFNLNISGAHFAWDYFHPSKPLPLLLQHIEDQDIWKFVIPGTREFCLALRLLPFDFTVWHQLVADTPSITSPRYVAMLSEGGAIYTYMQQEINGLANSRLRMPAQLRGEPVDALQAIRHDQAVISENDLSWLAVTGIAINTNAMFASELGNQLAEQSGTFALIWQLAGDGEVKASLRSKGSFDVAAIAARYDGGGHRNAAGFRMSLNKFMTEVLRS